MRRVALFTALISLGFASQLSADTVASFATRHEVPLENAVITVADFNGDGLSDLIAAMPVPGSTSGQYELNIQINNGKGGFKQGPTADLPSSSEPTAIAVGDFNGDGRTDIAILSSNSSSLAILLQTANQFLISTIEIPEYFYSTVNIAVGDLNNDGYPDIVIPSGSGTVVLFGEGKGAFRSPVLATTTPATFVALADVNNDKKLDLLQNNGSSCCETSFLVALGDGRGGFDAPISQPALTATASRFAVADVNRDGKLDIAAATSGYGANALLVAYGNGDGTFQTPVSTALPSSFQTGLGVVAGDLNNDGAPDLAVISTYNGYGSDTALITFLNTGKGAFGASVIDSVGEVNYLAIANLNGDHFPDVVATSQGSGYAVSLLFNNESGALSDGELITTPYALTDMVAADFNGDEKLDLAAITYGGLTIYENTGNNASLFAPLSTLPFTSGPLVAGDFNDDGHLDLVVAPNGSAEVLLGEGNGSFLLESTSYTLGGYSGLLVAADMNNDGKLDLITGYPAVILGNGNGSFRAPVSSAEGCYSPTAIAVADFNRDGKPDVLVNCEGNLDIYPGNGDGTLAAPNYLGYFSGALSVAVADFNRDGMPDIVFSFNQEFFFPSTTGATVLLNQGNFVFQTGQTVPVPVGQYDTQGTQLVTGDYNDDGFVDFAVLDTVDSAFSIVLGKGDGDFAAPELFGTAFAPACMVSGRFRQPVENGYPDLAFCATPGLAVDVNSRK